jgi:hypothetical protein
MDIYIKAAPSSGNRSTAQLMKTGQTTSYRTGDDGDLERGRNVSFTVLAENNPFGNTNRFTDELGTQTYTKNIVIDWSTYDGSTVLGYRRTVTNNQSWNNAIDGALAVSIAPFTTGWRMTNRNELLNLFLLNQSNVLNYSPFNISGLNGMWTSNWFVLDSTQAYIVNPTNGLITAQSRTSTLNGNWIPCRTFTVTGTTLS